MDKLKLTIDLLYKKCNPNIFQVETSKQIAIKNTFMPQERAISSFELGINIKGNNYNIFAMGNKGIGKKEIITKFLSDRVKKQKPPLDWAYVHNFKSPNKPKALSFQKGEVAIFKKDMNKFVNDLKILIPATFEGNLYKEKANSIESIFLSKQQKQIDSLQSDATKLNIKVIKDEDEFQIIAFDSKDNMLSDESIALLPEEEGKKINNNIKIIKQKLQRIISSFPQIDKEKKNTLIKHNKKTLQKIITPLTRKIKNKWKTYKDIEEYMIDISNYILEHENDFLLENTPVKPLLFAKVEENPYEKFDVNVIVDQSINIKDKSNAPIVILDNPTPEELLGSVEIKTNLGNIISNFSNIKAGALHLANGGYLILPVRKFLEYPWFWQIFKNILKNQRIEFTNFSEDFVNKTIGIAPMSIPLDIKVILLGPEEIFYKLWNHDEDFRELFKIVADFSNEVPYNDKNAKTLAEIAAYVVKKEKLYDLNKFALAKTVEVAAKFTGSKKFITTDVGKITDILKEANYLCKKERKKIIEEEHVHQAYFAQIHRYGKFKDHLNHDIKSKVILLETRGLEIGQINGLAVVGINDVRFGNPQRITCLVYKGEKGVIDIERNVELSGSIHSKGVLILQSYIHSQFGKINPLSFSATLAFEQSYGKIDGDSATCAELYCILSSLSSVPLKQSIAVTGSMDQKGQVQAIGDINTKINGFFEICKDHLDGSHGIIMPKSNVQDLMLPVEVREAVTNNLFSIYAIEKIEEGFKILTGLELGVADENGNFPKDSVAYKITMNWRSKIDQNK